MLLRHWLEDAAHLRHRLTNLNGLIWSHQCKQRSTHRLNQTGCHQTEWLRGGCSPWLPAWWVDHAVMNHRVSRSAALFSSRQERAALLAHLPPSILTPEAFFFFWNRFPSFESDCVCVRVHLYCPKITRACFLGYFCLFDSVRASRSRNPRGIMGFEVWCGSKFELLETDVFLCCSCCQTLTVEISKAPKENVSKAEVKPYRPGQWLLLTEGRGTTVRPGLEFRLCTQVPQSLWNLWPSEISPLAHTLCIYVQYCVHTICMHMNTCR